MSLCFTAAAIQQLLLLAIEHPDTLVLPREALPFAGNVTPSAAVQYMQRFYSNASGMYGTYPADFWTTANGIEALINFIFVSGDHTLAETIPNTFSRVAGQYFASGYFDDQLWYANAWLREFEVSQDGAYLRQADEILRQMIEVHAAWDGSCGGGVNWGIGHKYKNTITNTLFGVATARLHVFGLPGAGGRRYDEWAKDTWDWLRTAKLLAADGLLVDGLDAQTCAPTGSHWTYNQVRSCLAERACMPRVSSSRPPLRRRSHAPVSKILPVHGDAGHVYAPRGRDWPHLYRWERAGAGARRGAGFNGVLWSGRARAGAHGALLRRQQLRARWHAVQGRVCAAAGVHDGGAASVANPAAFLHHLRSPLLAPSRACHCRR